MSLAKGPHHLAIPGPSITPERVLRAMHRPAPNIYGGELIDLTQSLIEDLKAMANCSGDVVIYHGNGHAAWEASLCNLFSKGDHIVVINTGRFGQAWGWMAEEMGIRVSYVKYEENEDYDFGRLAEVLSQDTNHEIKAVLTVQTDTATSCSNDIVAIRKAMKDVNHPALYMVDAIASFGCEPMDMEALDVDVLLTASQKGLMVPPGVGLLFVGQKVWQYHESANLNTPYWNMKPRVNPVMFADHFCGTPPTQQLYGLREAMDMILEEGLDNVFRRHQTLAECVWSATDAWSAVGEISCRVPHPKHRSHAVTAIRTGPGDALRIREWCEVEMGVTLGVGLGYRASDPIVDDVFRIGHMGHLNPPTLLGVLASIDTALKALEIPHGPAALDAASSALSQAIAAR